MKLIKRYLLSVGTFLGALMLVACSERNEPAMVTAIDEDSDTENKGYDELYRPQIHYTPAKNWINDPNGLVFADGVYHMYYQYNPYGNSWGNMSWGHAVSKDLIHWEEKSEAMLRNQWGDIFSGCVVVDKANTSGFGKNALVVVYTASGQCQQQCVAYSDDGAIFKQYDRNPVIGNPANEGFRDPNVFWHEETQQWIMLLAKSDLHHIEFWSSKDLKAWSKLNEFKIDNADCNRGQWECPCLIRMDYLGQEKWVLIVSVNPGGPVLGSGTQYFVGQFDGVCFMADPLDYPKWIDYGPDNYAGIVWNNLDNRHVFIGWMNNWSYAGNVPASPWRSAMTLPREIRLTSYQGKPLLCSTVVKEIEQIADSWIDVGATEIKGAYQLRVKIDLNNNSTIKLTNDYSQMFRIDIDARQRILYVGRNAATGVVDFNGTFSLPQLKSPLNTDADQVMLDIFVDQSSVEIFTENGSMAQTSLVFPTHIYDKIRVDGDVLECKIRHLKSVW